MTKTVMMPRELTAENGAKKLFLGEFKEEIELGCPECYGGTGEINDDCDCCGGSGEITVNLLISWATIKAIYAMAVKNLAIKDN